MKTFNIKSLFLLLIIFMAACTDGFKKEKIIVSEKTEVDTFQIQLIELKQALDTARRKLSNEPEPEQDPEKLSKMTVKDRLIMEGPVNRYQFEKIRLFERSKSLIKNIEDAKLKAEQSDDKDTLLLLDDLLTQLVTFNQQVAP